MLSNIQYISISLLLIQIALTIYRIKIWNNIRKIKKKVAKDLGITYKDASMMCDDYIRLFGER